MGACNTISSPSVQTTATLCDNKKMGGIFSSRSEVYTLFFQTKKTFDRSVIVVSPCLNHMNNDLSLPGRRQLLAISCFGGNI